MKSLRGAINAKCKDCIYDPLSGLGNWRQQVASCAITGCPLWLVRPISVKRSKGPKKAAQQGKGVTQPAASPLTQPAASPLTQPAASPLTQPAASLFSHLVLARHDGS